MASTPETDLRAYPSRPILAASAAVFKDGKVLIARRGRAPAAGLWSLPGGVVEIGESLHEAAAREVWEETGINADMVAPADHVEIIQRDSRSRVARHYVIICFAALWRAGEARAGDGTEAVRWVAPDGLAGVRLTDGTAASIGKAAALLGMPTVVSGTGEV